MKVSTTASFLALAIATYAAPVQHPRHYVSSEFDNAYTYDTSPVAADVPLNDIPSVAGCTCGTPSYLISTSIEVPIPENTPISFITSVIRTTSASYVNPTIGATPIENASSATTIADFSGPSILTPATYIPTAVSYSNPYVSTPTPIEQSTPVYDTTVSMEFTTPTDHLIPPAATVVPVPEIPTYDTTASHEYQTPSAGVTCTKSAGYQAPSVSYATAIAQETVSFSDSPPVENQIPPPVENQIPPNDVAKPVTCTSSAGYQAPSVTSSTPIAYETLSFSDSPPVENQIPPYDAATPVENGVPATKTPCTRTNNQIIY